ncbi:MAG: DUF2147 domain-containing protein [Rubrivivax sp.]|nr:DUF2147 domain-containing protein [Rubrivivax sp.]MCW5611412.1 DUF2147 domain-containing protein [Rubrivivax sp.]
MKRLLTGLLLASAASLALAQATPVGVWKTIDDKTKTEKSIVRISESGGVLSGRIERLLAPDAKPDGVCDKCGDDRKDQKVVGLEIIRGAKKAEGENLWEGGTILDPNDGKVYRLRLKPEDDGKRLEVRGYVGPFFRNQHWIRVE